jgi:type III restriction enzyme
MSREPEDVDLVKPQSKLEPTSVREGETVTPLPTYKKHLLCNEAGDYPANFNAWERTVLNTEMQRAGFAFWYRNPQQPGQSSLGIAYLSDDDQYKMVRPDFIFFGAKKDGTIVADIVDPHGIHLGDALSKLQGLALYAKTHADAYRRIESVAEVDGKLRVLDLTTEEVRKAIDSASDVATLYRGALASDYK